MILNVNSFCVGPHCVPKFATEKGFFSMLCSPWTYEWVMSQTGMGHVPHVNASWLCGHTSEACHTWRAMWHRLACALRVWHDPWVMSHALACALRMSHVTHQERTGMSHVTHDPWVMSHTPTCALRMSHFTHQERTGMSHVTHDSSVMSHAPTCALRMSHFTHQERKGMSHVTHDSWVMSHTPTCALRMSHFTYEERKGMVHVTHQERKRVYVTWTHMKSTRERVISHTKSQVVYVTWLIAHMKSTRELWVMSYRPVCGFDVWHDFFMSHMTRLIAHMQSTRERVMSRRLVSSVTSSSVTWRSHITLYEEVMSHLKSAASLRDMTHTTHEEPSCLCDMTHRTLEEHKGSMIHVTQTCSCVYESCYVDLLRSSSVNWLLHKVWHDSFMSHLKRLIAHMMSARERVMSHMKSARSLSDMTHSKWVMWHVPEHIWRAPGNESCHTRRAKLFMRHDS